MINQKIADIFQETGNILEILGENKFHYLAYLKASQTVSGLAKDLADMYRRDPEAIDNISGIGKALSAKIVEIIETGECQYHLEMRDKIPAGLLEILKLRGVGPKKVKLFWTELKIDTVAKLKQACEDHIIQALPRMGAKSEAEIIESIEQLTHVQERMGIAQAQPIADTIVKWMERCKGINKVQYAGSLRRKRESVGDLDIIACGEDNEKILQHFVDFDLVEKVLAHGDTKSSVVIEGGLQIDCRVVDERSFGAALYYFTGSMHHNVATRSLAIKSGLRINEYGIFKSKEKITDVEQSIASETEEDCFKALGLPYIEPELRENMGEVEYGLKHKKMPTLVELKDLKGDLHNHTLESDGSASLEDMVKSAKEFGMEYMAITDHSKSAYVANGLSHDRVLGHLVNIEELDKKMKDPGAGTSSDPGKRNSFKILKGTECDIMKDGSLDYDEKTLKLFDIVVVSIHSHFKLSSEDQTRRLIRAIENPYTKILAHPTGRHIGKRPPIEFDFEKVFLAAKINKVALEINSQPKRLDLKDIHIKLAKDVGCKFVIDSDSHIADNYGSLQFGVNNARRGWLTKDDVLNTLPLDKMMGYFN